ncbi:MAG: hypothetical protein ABEJ42_04850 [Halobacteriaceae archaeon]
MNRDALESLLSAAFEADAGERRVVARAAGDLADSGVYEPDHGVELTPERVVDHLEDAPEGYGLVERWNWWMGALEVAHGGYDRFYVRVWTEA